MGIIARLRSPGAAAIRGAGPPEWQVVAAFAIGTIVDLGLAGAAGFGLPLAAYAVPPGLLTLVVCLVDRSGPTVRAALAYVALEQRRRSAAIRMPVTRDAAERWLAADQPGASTLERASVMVTAGRYREAADAIESFDDSTPLDHVRVLRLRMSVTAALDPTKAIDLEAIRSAAADLSPEERRHQVLSAAWTRVWLAISRRQPWLQAFKPIAREYGPYALPVRVRAAITVQHFVAPIACLIVGLLVALVAPTL